MFITLHLISLIISIKPEFFMAVSNNTEGKAYKYISW